MTKEEIIADVLDWLERRVPDNIDEGITVLGAIAFAEGNELVVREFAVGDLDQTIASAAAALLLRSTQSANFPNGRRFT